MAAEAWQAAAWGHALEVPEPGAHLEGFAVLGRGVLLPLCADVCLGLAAGRWLL